MIEQFDPARDLASDWREALWLGRLDLGEGPTPVLIAAGLAYDISHIGSTVAEVITDRGFDPAAGRLLGPAEKVAGTWLAPIDLQCVKAAGVTFATSTLERVIEEAARGDAEAADAIRTRMAERIGGDLRATVPGSAKAAELKAALIEDGLWSQYLEVAIGPDAEIFTKAPVLAAVGPGAEIGIRTDSDWNNPEPEIVLVVAPDGAIVGATLGNDVNLRDFEGRSALLLGKAKDNNASCAIGPLIRLFDEHYSLEDVRLAEISLSIAGEDEYSLVGSSSMRQISRDPAELVRQTLSEHQYPDGFVLFCGTLFAPVQDRDTPGRGFTHKIGDVVTIAEPRLGRLVNRVTTSASATPWSFGISHLMRNLARRGLLRA